MKFGLLQIFQNFRNQVSDERLWQGGIELALAWQHRPGHGMDDNSWIWLGLSGAITILLALLLMAGLPGTALWALGLLIGLNFLSSGISFVMLAGAARTL